MTKTIEPDAALWELVLAEVEVIKAWHKGEITGTGRSEAMWAGSGAVTAHLTIYLRGGEVLLYVVTARAGSPYVKPSEPKVTFKRYHEQNDHYWMRQVDGDEEDQRGVVVDGVHYRLGPNKPGRGEFKGFGGRRFEIEWLDGRPSVVTNDLWYQGRIPDKYRILLPDNAKFVQ